MSLKYEQYRSLWESYKLLQNLSNPRHKETKTELRRRARQCLRHFPFLLNTGQPMFSNDGFECPDLRKKEEEGDEV